MAYKEKNMRQLGLAAAAVMVGVVAGLGAVVFRGLIGLFHNLSFLGILSTSYDANVHTPAGPWGPFVILVPLAGAVGVSFLVSNFAPEAKGHGVPEVMDATYYHRGVIRPIVGLIKAAASALCIGTGGSVGREGPIVQIGASFGSTLGKVLKLQTWQTVTLIAAGGAGGIAATFNTPLGGILFAIELLMPEVSVRTLVPVVVSTVTATSVGQYFFGTHPSFVIPAFDIGLFRLETPDEMLFYAVLGIIMGAASVLFIKSIYWTEELFERLALKSYYLRHMLGMLVVGLIMYLLMENSGHYFIEGVGYSTVQDILEGVLQNAWFLMLLFALKLAATSLTLGSGGSGGVFSPSLFLGAAIGSAYGSLLKLALPGLDIPSTAFAVAGMAGMVGGVTGASIMAIIMIFEMTLDYSVIVPMTITVIISFWTRKSLHRDSVYTEKLVKRGHHMPESLKVDFTRLRRAREVMDTDLNIISSGAMLRDFALMTMGSEASAWYLVEQDGRIVGILHRIHALGAIGLHVSEVRVGDVAEKDYILVKPEDKVLDIDQVMQSRKAELALVSGKDSDLAPGDVLGIITLERIRWSIGAAVEIVSE